MQNIKNEKKLSISLTLHQNEYILSLASKGNKNQAHNLADLLIYYISWYLYIKLSLLNCQVKLSIWGVKLVGFRSARIQAGLSVAQVMKILSVSDAAVYQWETGETTPNAKRLPEIAKLYGVTVDELLSDDPQ